MTLAEYALWLAVGMGILAVVVGVGTFREALLDHRVVTRAGIGNGRRLVAARALQSEISRLAVLLLLTGTGVLVGTSSDTPVTSTLVLARLTYLLVQMILAADGVLALLARRELLDFRRAKP